MKHKVIMNIILSFKANTSPLFQFISSMWLAKSLIVQ